MHQNLSGLKRQEASKTKTIKVRITYNNDYKKPFIGGIKDLYSNKIYYHSFSQTNQDKQNRPIKLERETQTKKVTTKACNVKREFGTQTKRNDLFIDDRIVTVIPPHIIFQL